MAARVLGRHVYLLVNSAKWLLPIALGELDEFQATSTTDIIKSRPIGFILEAATLRYGGYDLQFKIGKTDAMLERWNHLVDRGLIIGEQPPELFITEIVKHYDSQLGIPVFENWIYKNVSLFGTDINFSGPGDYEQSINGFAAYKELGPVDTSFLKIEWLPQLGFQEVVFRTNDIGGGVADDITNIVNNVLSGKAPRSPGMPIPIDPQDLLPKNTLGSPPLSS